MTLPAETSDRLQRLLAAMLDERLSDEQVGRSPPLVAR